MNSNKEKKINVCPMCGSVEPKTVDNGMTWICRFCGHIFAKSDVHEGLLKKEAKRIEKKDAADKENKRLADEKAIESHEAMLGINWVFASILTFMIFVFVVIFAWITAAQVQRNNPNFAPIGGWLRHFQSIGPFMLVLVAALVLSGVLAFIHNRIKKKRRKNEEKKIRSKHPNLTDEEVQLKLTKVAKYQWVFIGFLPIIIAKLIKESINKNSKANTNARGLGIRVALRFIMVIPTVIMTFPPFVLTWIFNDVTALSNGHTIGLLAACIAIAFVIAFLQGLFAHKINSPKGGQD